MKITIEKNGPNVKITLAERAAIVGRLRARRADQAEVFEKELTPDQAHHLGALLQMAAAADSFKFILEQ